MAAPGAAREEALQRALDTVSPVAPPDEAIAEIQRIATAAGVEVPEDLQWIAERFLEHHDIDPDGPAVVAQLRSGYRVYGDGDDAAVLDEIVNGITGDAIQTAKSAAEPEAGWSSFFATVYGEMRADVEHLVGTLHEFTVRALLRESLRRTVRAHFEELFEEAFPHLKADPEKVTALAREMKQAAVLLLGQDSADPGRERLERIREAIEARGRTAVLIKEQEDDDDQGLVGKLLINAALVRYVVIENSFPSGHLYEIPHIEAAGVVAAVLQEEGRGASFLPDETILKNSLFERFTYRPETLEDALARAMEWAEDKVEEVGAVHRQAREGWRE